MTSCTLDNFQACKDPEELLDYIIDYSGILSITEPPDSIVSSSWTVTPTGLTIEADAIGELDQVAVWISGGGKLESRYRLVNHIATVSGREFERTILITIRNK